MAQAGSEAARAGAAVRRGEWTSPTAGLAPGYTQANPVMLPQADAFDFLRFWVRYPTVHGAPVHVGDPQALGIANLATPDYGDAVESRPGEIPVFWACGVTPQAVAAASRPELIITHAPGHMFVTGVPDARQATL